MKNISTIRIILSISFLLLFCCNIYSQDFLWAKQAGGNGDTEVAKWKDDKQAAIAIGFDDSQDSQLDNAVPNLESRGLTAVFYVNQGKNGYTSRESEWLDILNRGQHLAPHTMTHSGATSYNDAVYEIGRSAELVWEAYGVPYHSMLLSYASGGGVTWTGLTRQQRLDIDDSFNLINRAHYYGCSTCSNPEHWHSNRMPQWPYLVNLANYSESELVIKINNTISQEMWGHFYGHGVGDGHSTSMAVFLTFVNHLQSVESNIWNASYIDIFKYDMERFSAEVEVLQSTEDIIELRLSSDISASGYITNDVNLYNEPLTLITQVPWSSVTVTQGSSSKTYTANNGEVMYEALPNVGTTNRGDIILEHSDGLPVELTSFSASVKNSSVTLNWETATEVNNYGFEILRRIYPALGATQNIEWQNIGFVEGNGNSNSPKYYSFTDYQVLHGNYKYKLKQIDNDGTFEYSNEIEVFVGKIPNNFNLEQNYPNPFNPTTNIKYSVAVKSHLVIKVFNALGSEVAILVNEEKPIGSYEVEFDATSLPSGVYFYRIIADNFVKTKKMVLMK